MSASVSRLPIYLCMRVCIYVCIYLHLSFTYVQFHSTCLYIYLPIFPPIRVSTYPPLSIHVSTYPPIYLSR